MFFNSCNFGANERSVSLFLDKALERNIQELKYLNLKRFLVVQNFSKALKIGFISFNLSSVEKGC